MGHGLLKGPDDRMVAAFDQFGELQQLFRQDRLPAPKLRALQEQRLRALLSHAYDHVPYYGQRYRDAGIAPHDVCRLEDIRSLPVTTKADLKQAGLPSIVARGLDLKSCILLRTGGTSGDQFDVYRSRRENRTVRLVRLRAMHRAGTRPWDRFAVLGLEAREYRPLSARLGLYQTWSISTRWPLEEQIAILRRVQPTVLRFWPTDLAAVMQALSYRMSDVIHPRLLISSAEVLGAALRRRVVEDLQAPILNFYVAAEFGEIASECPRQEGLHLNADQLILECLREDGQPAGPGEPGVAVITSLFSYSMPLIRYLLGDVTALLDRPCSCGSTLPLIRAPIGRQEDLVRLPSGKVLSVIGLGLVVDDVDAIDRYRFVQEAPDHMVLLLVLRQPMSEESVSRLRSGLLAYLGEPVTMEIRAVESISEDKVKFRKFISRLSSSPNSGSGSGGADRLDTRSVA
jgi:phenylacetate-CoA ligase